MNVLGSSDEAERAHEFAELGDAVNKPGPLSAMTASRDLQSLARLYESSLSDLQAKVAKLSASDPKLAYLRTLVILTKKVELDLRAQVDGLARLSRELDEMHDYVHEMFPLE
jgi:hypothetical protein